ncbi:MAG: 4Fe-4S binding protein [Candidatus Lindowbacteria bacterium]|nr:4Fe-4S binding protein [Candidatus Lindowbacteria bacterium]
MRKGMLIDTTMCIGCLSCEEACKEKNNLSAECRQDDLSECKFTKVFERGDYYVRKMCMHCLEPACASVCPVGALKKLEEGPVVYDEDKCIGCRYCMQACPFQVPTYEWAFGERSELLVEARRRIAETPGQYQDHIFGEREVGGTSMLFLAAVPFEQIGFKSNLIEKPLPLLTWSVLSKIPDFVLVGGTLLGGVAWIITRRMVLEDERLQKSQERAPQGSDSGLGLKRFLDRFKKN